MTNDNSPRYFFIAFILKQARVDSEQFRPNISALERRMFSAVVCQEVRGRYGSNIPVTFAMLLESGTEYPTTN